MLFNNIHNYSTNSYLYFWVIAFVIYIFNNLIIKNITTIVFFHCYFNDLLASIVFLSFLDFILYFIPYRTPIITFWQTMIIILFAGLFWEYISPFYRVNSVSDPYDLIMYFIGALIYWFPKNMIRN